MKERQRGTAGVSFTDLLSWDLLTREKKRVRMISFGEKKYLYK